MRQSAAQYLRLALAELEREKEEYPPFSVERRERVSDANVLRDMLRRNGEELR